VTESDRRAKDWEWVADDGGGGVAWEEAAQGSGRHGGSSEGISLFLDPN